MLKIFLLVALFSMCKALDGPFPATDEIPVDKSDNTSSAKFTLRYYQNNGNYKEGGPLFLYLGGQKKLEEININELKVVEEMAVKLSARLVVLEHRFYGGSVPYNGDATAYTDIKKLSKLSIERVLDDIEAALPKLSNDMKPVTKPFLFGSGYSGLLALLYNLKHAGTNNAPNGTWISSSPAREFIDPNNLGSGHEAKYDAALTTLFTSTAFGCKSSAVSSAFTSISALAKDKLRTAFGIADEAKLSTDDHVAALKAYIVQAIRDLASVNYPYEVTRKFQSGDKKIKKWPVTEFCSRLNADGADDDKKVENLHHAIVAAYLDPEKTPVDNSYVFCTEDKCSREAMLENRGLTENEIKAKDWQRCTEVVFERCAGMSTDNIDFFYKQCQAATNEDYRLTICKKLMGNTVHNIEGYTDAHFKPDFIKNTFSANLDKLQKVIFSSGKFDQYWGANYQKSTPDRQVYAYNIAAAAPALDLSPPNKCDPPSVTEARTQIGNILQCWAQVVGRSDDVNTRCEKKVQQVALSESEKDTNKEANCGAAENSWPWTQIDYPSKPDPPPTEPPPTTQPPTKAPDEATTIQNSVSGLVPLLGLLLVHAILSFVLAAPA